jgi:hypothetical protein
VAHERAVVDDAALAVAPGRVDDATRLDGHGLAGDDAIDQPIGIRAGHAVLEEGRDIDERRGVAQRVVLDVDMRRIRARAEHPRPFTPLSPDVQLEGALVKG